MDPLVSPEAVFPDIEDRNKYLHEAPSTENGLRSAAFLLRPQPGMIEARHFYVVTFTFACSGTFVNQAEPDPVMANTGGPNGSFTSLSARTHDGAYDVRVSQGGLLPEVVHPPKFSLETALKALMARYDLAGALHRNAEPEAR